jgi:UDP-glucose 4-epimerase
MNAAVIGANGYLGRHLVHTLGAAGHHVVPYGRQPLSVDGFEHYRQLDVTERDSFDVLDVEVDAIFMFAGLSGTAVGFDRYEEFVATNEVGLLNLLDRMRKRGSPARLVFPSTRLVYRGVSGMPLAEDAAKEAKTVYAVTKIACEYHLRAFHNRFGIPYTIVRICVPYGSHWPESQSYGTLGFMLGRAARGEPVVLFGDGSQRRTFSHVDDLCRQLIPAAAMAATRNDVFNVGGEDLSLLEVGAAIARKFGVDVRCQPWAEHDLAIESGDTIFDSTRLDSVTGYRRVHAFAGWLESL